MASPEVDPGALHVVWSIPAADATSAKNLHACLAQGSDSRLFTLEHWGVFNGEAHAVLVPRSPLDRIADLIWNSGHAPRVLRLASSPLGLDKAA